MKMDLLSGPDPGWDRKEPKEDLVRPQGEWAEWEVVLVARDVEGDKFIGTQIFADVKKNAMRIALSALRISLFSD